jgi:hypothetical protein
MTSLPLDNQLVLKLERGVKAADLFQVNPTSGTCTTRAGIQQQQQQQPSLLVPSKLG